MCAMTAIAPFLPVCNTQASAVILATPLLSTTGVLCAAVDPATGDVYIGGTFLQVDGANRACLACITRQGVLKSWNPGVNSGAQVNDMRWVAGVGLYVIGNFTGIGGGSGATSRYGQALLDASANVLTWDPNPTAAGGLPNGGATMDVDSSGNVYLSNGGTVYQVSPAAVVSSWSLGFNFFSATGIQKICIIGGKLYCGGGISQVNTSATSHIAVTGLCRIDTTSGYADSWAPSFLVSGSSSAINIFGLCGDSAGTLYVAGNFDHVLATAQSSFASINPTGPSLNSWLPIPTTAAAGYRVAANGLDIYWTTINGASVNASGCMSSAGVDLAWDPYTGGSHGGSSFIAEDIAGFVFDPSNPIVPVVYAFGYFSTVLNAGLYGPIVRLQFAKFADRTFSPTHLAY
jgi:hypothetical protein